MKERTAVLMVAVVASLLLAASYQKTARRPSVSGIDLGWAIERNATANGERLWECVHYEKRYDRDTQRWTYGYSESYTYYTEPEECPPPRWELEYRRRKPK